MEDEKRLLITKSKLVQNINQYAANIIRELKCHACKESFPNLSAYVVHQEKCNDTFYMRNNGKFFDTRKITQKILNKNIRLKKGIKSETKYNIVDSVLRNGSEETEFVQIVRPVIRKRSVTVRNTSNRNHNYLGMSEHGIKCCKVKLEKLEIKTPPNEYVSSPKAFQVFMKEIPKQRNDKDANKDLMIKKIFPVLHHNEIQCTNDHCNQNIMSNSLQNGPFDSTEKDRNSRQNTSPLRRSTKNSATSPINLSALNFSSPQIELNFNTKRQSFLDGDIDYLKSFLYLKPVVKLKKLSLESTTLKIRVPSLSIAPSTSTVSQVEIKDSAQDNVARHNMINSSQNNNSYSAPLSETTSTITKVTNTKEEYNEKNESWGVPLLKFGHPVALVERLDFTNTPVQVVEGSIPKESLSIDSLPLPPTFDPKYLDLEENEMISDHLEIRAEQERVSVPTNTLDMFPNDPLLVGVTDNNAWVHKDINSPIIHSRLSTPNCLENQKIMDNKIYEVLDSTTIAIECINDSASEGDIESLESASRSQGDTNHEQIDDFNPLLNLDGLK